MNILGWFVESSAKIDIESEIIVKQGKTVLYHSNKRKTKNDKNHKLDKQKLRKAG